MVTLMVVVSGLMFFGGVALCIVKSNQYSEAVKKASQVAHYSGSREAPVIPVRPNLTALIVTAVVGLLVLVSIMTGGAAQVPATHIAVIENTATGQFYTLGPGTHVWPISPQLFPMITKITKYDLRQQIVEIGGEPASVNGVQADSSSPGRPTVFFYARGFAAPNPKMIVELHRRYGSDYLNTWVERTWINALKNVQRPKPYDYVGNHGLDMQNEVEAALQTELSIDGEPLVYVSQIAINDFAFDENVTGYLDGVAKKEFERQQAEQQILINTKSQEAQKIQADTDFIIKKRGAEAEQSKLVAEAEGRAEATKVEAEAAAYSVKVKYEAEANGIRQVQQALSSAPDAYLRYKSYDAWDGKLPVTMLGTTAVPFMDVPMVSEK
jgi:hypothetical protein